MSGGGPDGASTGTMIFVTYPFTSSGSIVEADIRVVKTTGTLLLGVYARTSGSSGGCGGFQRLRSVTITRTTTGTDTVSYAIVITITTTGTDPVSYAIVITRTTKDADAVSYSITVA